MLQRVVRVLHETGCDMVPVNPTEAGGEINSGLLRPHAGILYDNTDDRSFGPILAFEHERFQLGLPDHLAEGD